MDDAFHLLQKDGRASVLFGDNTTSFPRKIVSVFVLCLQLAMIFLVVAVVVRLVVYGYPRSLYDLATFSWYRSEDLSALVSERRRIVQHLDFLSSSEGADGMQLYGSAITPLKDRVDAFRNTVKDVYRSYAKYDDGVHQTIKDYYLYYDRVLVKDPPPGRPLRHEGKEVFTRSYPFYELLATVQVRTGQISRVRPNAGGAKGDDQLMYEVFVRDRDAGFQTLERMTRVRRDTEALAREVARIHEDAFQTRPVFVYVSIPSSESEIGAWSNAASRRDVRDARVAALFEALNESKDAFDVAFKGMPHSTIDARTKATLIKYLGTDPPSRANVRLDPKVKELATYLETVPLFAYVHMNGHRDPQALYASIRAAYRTLMNRGKDAKPDVVTESDVRNLHENGTRVKRMLLAVSVLHLYLNVYRETMTRYSEKQYLSDARFFQELWKPFVDDLLVNRIGYYIKQTFLPTNVRGTYNSFRAAYARLGNNLKRMTNAVFRAFFTSTPIEQPEEVRADEGRLITAD